MANLKSAHNELFRRGPDETFETLSDLRQFCRDQKEQSTDVWQTAQGLIPSVAGDSMQLHIGSDGAFSMNHWSFSQLCTLCGVNKDTINRLSPETASRALQETMPRRGKPLQLLLSDEMVRSIHGTHYSRLWNIDLLNAVLDVASGFSPPQKARSGGTGLYAGQQDMFMFLVDPAGWAEIEGQAFAPGFFAFNSEVGRRSFGVQTFWWQAVCGNHIVWDAAEIVSFQKRHTGNVTDSLSDIRSIIADLVAKRDARKDSFAAVVSKAMQSRIGTSDDAEKFLLKNGITRSLVTRAVKKLGEEGKPFTIFTLVDALTQLTQEVRYAGDRTEADEKVSKLLTLAL